MRYTLTPSPITDLPVSLDDAKAWLAVDHSEHDAILVDLITEAAEAVEEVTGRAQSARSFRYEVSTRESVALYQIDLPREPVEDVEVTYMGAALVPLVDYTYSGSRVMLTRGAVVTVNDSVVIDFTTGTHVLKTAILQAVRRAYDYRSGVVEGPASILPRDIVDTLLPYRRVTV